MVHVKIAMTTLTCACVKNGEAIGVAKKLATRVIATTIKKALTCSPAVLGCVRQKLQQKPVSQRASVAALVVTHLNPLVRIVNKILTSALQSVVEASTHAGQRGSRACARAIMTKRTAEHGSKTCVSAAQKSVAQSRAQMRMVSRFAHTLVVRLRISIVTIAMTILTGACKSTRTVTSGPARKPEMLAIAPSDRVTTGRNAERL